MFISKGMTEDEAQLHDQKQAKLQAEKQEVLKLSGDMKIIPIRKGISPEFAYVKQLFHGFKFKRVAGSNDIIVWKEALCCSKIENTVKSGFCCRPIALSKYTVCLQLPLSDAELAMAHLQEATGEIPMEGLVNDILHETQCIVCWNKYINVLRG